MVFKVILLSIALMAVVFVLFSINILLKKDGKFPSLHIGGNKEMKKRGISCATSQDREARKKGKAF